MCGLFGFQESSKRPLRVHERVLLAYTLGDEAESRGRHACGVAGYLNDNADIALYKEDTAFTNSVDIMVELTRLSNVIGHTRYATVGAHTAENAHPFEYKHIIGCHNGGIFNHRTVAWNYRDTRPEMQVDSQQLIAHIADDADMSELDGYGAVSWLDLRDPGAVYLCRMEGGELHAERLKDGGLVWGSTHSIIEPGLRVIGEWVGSRAVALKEAVVYRVFDGVIEETTRRIKLLDKRPSFVGTKKKSRSSGKVVDLMTPKAPSKGKDSGVTSQTDYERLCEEYARDYDRYIGTGADDSDATTRRQPGNAKPRYTPRSPLKWEADTAIAARYWLDDDQLELVQKFLDRSTRRERRRIKGIANNILPHPPSCHCQGCSAIATLLCEVGITSGDIGDTTGSC